MRGLFRQVHRDVLPPYTPGRASNFDTNLLFMAACTKGTHTHKGGRTVLTRNMRAEIDTLLLSHDVARHRKPIRVFTRKGGQNHWECT